MVNNLRWQDSTHRWLSKLKWQDSIRRWLSKLKWQDSTHRWLSKLKWQDSTHRWLSKLSRWLNKLIKWDRGSSRFIVAVNQFRWLGSPTKCQTSRFRWALLILKPVSQWADIRKLGSPFRWEVTLRPDNRKWGSLKWVVIRRLRNLYLKCSQVSPSNFLTSQPRDSQANPRPSLANSPQASLSLRRHLHHSPRGLEAEARTNHNNQWEVVRNRESLSQEEAARKCPCTRSLDRAVVHYRIYDVDGFTDSAQQLLMMFIVITKKPTESRVWCFTTGKS